MALRDAGKCRAVGVSNFGTPHLAGLAAAGRSTLGGGLLACAIAVGGGLVAGSLFVWARSRTEKLRPRFAFTALAVTGFLVALFAPGFAKPPQQATVARSNGQLEWQAFAPDTIPALIANGKTVLVDVTAEWCITCQVNKRLVLNQGAVHTAISDGRLIAMKADWTRPNPVIAAYLAKFGRYGIPFNAVYGPEAPGGIPLPELLTEDIVTQAVAKAGNVVIAEK